MTGTEIIFAYLGIINVVTFLTYGADKSRAQSGRWRVPERTLLGLAVIGGSLGAWLGMKTFHHKTQKSKFYIGVRIILLIHVILLMVINMKFYR